MAVQWGLLDTDMPAKVGGSFQQGQRNALAMQAEQQEQQMNALRLQQAQQEMGNQNALREAYRSSGGDTGKLLETLKGSGDYESAMKIQKGVLDQQKADMEAKKAELEGHAKRIEYTAQVLSSSHDQASHDANLAQLAQEVGEENIQNVPRVFNPQELQFIIKKGMTVKDQAYQQMRAIDQAQRERQLTQTATYQQAQLGLGQQAGRRAEQELGLKAQEDKAKQTAGKPLSQKQESMLMGASNTIDAINDYRETLSQFKTSDLINPDSRAELENKYNNMLMQVKEVYALGALTGPDQGVLENILKNPISFKGAITSTKALDKQAEDMIRIMAKVGKTATMPKEQILEKLEKAGATESGASDGWTVEVEE
jgi:hypothetical protein